MLPLHTISRRGAERVSRVSQGTLSRRRRRFAGAERGSRVSQVVLIDLYEWVRATEHAPRDRYCLLERRHGLAEIVERGAGIREERPRVYSQLGREEEALPLRRDAYSGRLKLNGREHEETLRAANNYASILVCLHGYARSRRWNGSRAACSVARTRF